MGLENLSGAFLEAAVGVAQIGFLVRAGFHVDGLVGRDGTVGAVDGIVRIRNPDPTVTVMVGGVLGAVMSSGFVVD